MKTWSRRRAPFSPLRHGRPKIIAIRTGFIAPFVRGPSRRLAPKERMQSWLIYPRDARSRYAVAAVLPHLRRRSIRRHKRLVPLDGYIFGQPHLPIGVRLNIVLRFIVPRRLVRAVQNSILRDTLIPQSNGLSSEPCHLTAVSIVSGRPVSIEATTRATEQHQREKCNPDSNFSFPLQRYNPRWPLLIPQRAQ